jgi:hypothetical protein
MVIGTVFCNIPTKLGNFDFVLKFPLEACKQDLSLARFQTVYHIRNRSHVVSNGEVDEFFVHKVTIIQPLDTMVDEDVAIELSEPRLSCICLLLIKRKHDLLKAAIVLLLKLNDVLFEVREVFFGFSCCTCSQSFIILDLIRTQIADSILPRVVLCLGKESLNVLILRGAFGHLNNRSNKLLEESLLHQELWPKVMKEVDQKPLDMRAIMVLICHNHHASIPESCKLVGIIVFCTHLKADDFHQVLNLCVVNEHLVAGISNVQEFTFEWKYSVVVTSNYLDATHGQ